ncbi:MAG: hypothetical protein V4702_03045 [Patescibacteria group bacterium]
MSKQPDAKALFEKFYDKQLTEQQYKEIKFNLVRYIEFLIVLDKQHQDWRNTKTQSEVEPEK